MTAKGDIYELVCDELREIDRARRETSEAFYALCKWLRHPRMARDLAPCSEVEGMITQHYHDRDIFTCSVTENALVLSRPGFSDVHYPTGDLDKLKTVIVCLLARAIDEANKQSGAQRLYA